MRNGEISKVAVAKERRHGWLETAALDDKPAAEAEATLNSAIVVEPPVVAVAASAEAVLKGEGGRGKGPATRGKGKGGRGGTQPVDLAIKSTTEMSTSNRSSSRGSLATLSCHRQS